MGHGDEGALAAEGAQGHVEQGVEVAVGHLDVVAALWTTTMLIFAYVDLFSLYRADVRSDLEAGKVAAFEVNQAFLFFTTLYVIVPALMICLSLVMRRRVNRVVNVVVAAAYAVTIVGGAVGEWNYYLVGSMVEAALLALVIRHAWTWSDPRHRTAGTLSTGSRTTS